jgi:hypothetical protein
MVIMYAYFAYLTGYTASFLITTQFTVRGLFKDYIQKSGWGIPPLLRSLFIGVLWWVTVQWLVLIGVLLAAVFLLKKLIVNFKLSNSN